MPIGAASRRAARGWRRRTRASSCCASSTTASWRAGARAPDHTKNLARGSLRLPSLVHLVRQGLQAIFKPRVHPSSGARTPSCRADLEPTVLPSHPGGKWCDRVRIRAHASSIECGDASPTPRQSACRVASVLLPHQDAPLHSIINGTRKSSSRRAVAMAPQSFPVILTVKPSASSVDTGFRAVSRRRTFRDLSRSIGS